MEKTFAIALAAALAVPQNDLEGLSVNSINRESSLAYGGDWRLEWADEFDGHEVNPAVWTFEEGWVRNDELQYYTVGRGENARIEDGKLVITARKEKWPNRFYSPSAPTNDFKKGRAEASYTSASLHSRGKFEFRYGKLEVRAKIPEGLGTWPAIWMCGSGMRWPKCGEIDVMEAVGYRPGLVFATTHWSDKDTGEHVKNCGKIKGTPSDGFHIYAVEWDENKIDYFYDGQKYHTQDISNLTDKDGFNPFRRPYFLRLNLAFGGRWGGRMGVGDLADYVGRHDTERVVCPLCGVIQVCFA